MDTDSIGATSSSRFTLTEVDLHTDFSISRPSFSAHTGRITRTYVHTLSVDVTASTFTLEAGVDGRARVTVSFVSISTNTNRGEAAVVNAESVDVTVLHHSI